MDLTVRSMEKADFPACASLLNGRLAYPERLIADLPRTWLRLLDDEAMIGVVFENRDDSPPAVMLGFAATVFVTDAWVTEARSSSEPYLTARTVWSELRSPRSPILRPAAIRRESAAGLNILVLHYCERRDLQPELGRALRYRASQAFIESHRGYRIKEVIQEFWDEVEPAFVLKGWGKIRSDYSTYFTDRGEPRPPPGRRPYLIGLTREEALKTPGDPVAPVFTFTPPQLLFSRAERRLLRDALLGHTDLELASRLGIALPTVKSHWRAIYNRVSQTAPHLLPDEHHQAENTTIRGQEKRRRLLEYLRRHPEELRPGLDGPGRSEPKRSRQGL